MRLFRGHGAPGPTSAAASVGRYSRLLLAAVDFKRCTDQLLRELERTRRLQVETAKPPGDTGWEGHDDSPITHAYHERCSRIQLAGSQHLPISASASVRIGESQVRCPADSAKQPHGCSVLPMMRL